MSNEAKERLFYHPESDCAMFYTDEEVRQSNDLDFMQLVEVIEGDPIYPRVYQLAIKGTVAK